MTMVQRLFLSLLPTLLLAQNQVPDWVSVESNISYSTHKETVLDILQSKRADASAKRIGVIVIHGGGWVGGKKENVFDRLCLPYLE